jgi:hypothetical protein
MKIEAKELLHLPRYGHAAVAASDYTNKVKMFVFGGFSGAARHDVIKLTPTGE